jgi:Fe-S cluster assembly protein SufD
MVLAQAKADLATALLTDAPTSGGKWISAARENAASNLVAMGAPHGRDEYWKYTKPDTLTSEIISPAPVFSTEATPVFSDVDALGLVFVDGIFDAAQSDDLEMAGLSIELLADAGSKDIHWAKDVFGVLEGKGQNPVSRPLAALNTAKAEQGVVIHVTGNPSRPIWIRNLHTQDTSNAHVHHVIKLDEGCSFTLLESGAGAARFNSVVEVVVADKAEFHHVRTQGRDHDRRNVTHMFAEVGEESLFNSFTMTVNGVLTRNETVIEFLGDNAKATVAGASAGDGDGFHHDDTVFITHDSVNCESRQVFKKVLRNGATGVFQGKILVKADAQQTDGYQISQGLLLDDNSNFLAKPELEIYADDVACSHGSTVGAIDETALFYLTSRGIPRAQAQDMLILSFLGEAIDEVENSSLAEAMMERLSDWMARRRK